MSEKRDGLEVPEDEEEGDAVTPLPDLSKEENGSHITAKLMRNLTKRMLQLGDLGDERLGLLKVVGERSGWLIEPSDIELGEVIGKGSTATVYKSKWHGLEVAVKCLEPSVFENLGGLVSFCRELEIFSRQHHPYILPFLAGCLDIPDKCWLVTDLMSTTLTEWLHGSNERVSVRKIALPHKKDRIRIALEIGLALQHLHEQKPMVIHRDLKPSNIFVDSNNRAFISDFGFARLLRPGDVNMTGATGTFMYMAPEIIRNEQYDEKVDVYSYGIMLNELMCGYPPFIEVRQAPFQIATAVAKGGMRPFLAKTDVDPRILELVKMCWTQNPLGRPPMSHVTTELRTVLADVTGNKGHSKAIHRTKSDGSELGSGRRGVMSLFRKSGT